MVPALTVFLLRWTDEPSPTTFTTCGAAVGDARADDVPTATSPPAANTATALRSTDRRMDLLRPLRSTPAGRATAAGARPADRWAEVVSVCNLRPGQTEMPRAF